MAGTNPRAARIAALIQRVIASSMEAQLHDKRLTNVTITEVRVTNDLQIVGHTHFGDGHVCETLIVQLRLHGGCDHTLDQRRDACGARIGSCHCCPLIR